MKISTVFQPLCILYLLFLVQATNSQTLKILPLGNSLTKGVFCIGGSISGCVMPEDDVMVGYRYQLYNSLMGAGFNFEFVGNEFAGYSVFPDYNLARHAGYPGITSSKLNDKVNLDNKYLLTSAQPDIVLLEIGTNDVLAGSTNIGNVRNILDAIGAYEISSGRPVLVFLSKIIKFTQGTNNEGLVATFNSLLFDLYQQRVSAGDLIQWVDVGATLYNRLEPLGDMKDELHPNQAGYDEMALQWFQAINGYNNAPTVSQIPNQTIDEGNIFPALSLDGYVYDSEDTDANITWTIQPASENFDIVINGSRQALISPKDANWNGTENITFIASDRGKSGITGLKKSTPVTVAFTVNPVNDPPVILGQTRIPVTPEERPYTVDISDLQVQDIDNPSTNHSIQILSGANYTFTGASITPAVNFNGELTVFLRVNDLQASSPDFNFKISVSPVNDVPVINAGRALIYYEDTPFEIRLADLTVNDPDNFYPADFTLYISNGLHFSHSGNTITPDKDYNGIIQVPVRVKDLLDMSNEYLYSITIDPVNDSPSLILPANRSGYEGDYFEMQVEPRDTDQTDILQVSAITLPNWLTFNASKNKLSGTPAHQFVGEHTVKLRVSDSKTSADSTFTVKVLLKTGIGDNPGWEKEYLVYPNPAKDYIHVLVKSPGNLPASFMLFNSAGIGVMMAELNQKDTTLTLNIQNLSSGVYFFRILNTNGENFMGQLIIMNDLIMY